MKKDDSPNPQINVSKIAVGGGIAGAIFTAGSMMIFLLGIPLLRFVFPAAIVLGCAVALVLHFVRHETPGAPWLLSATGKETEYRPQINTDEHRLKQLRMNLSYLRLSVFISG
jgi:hypothetical protein